MGLSRHTAIPYKQCFIVHKTEPRSGDIVINRGLHPRIEVHLKPPSRAAATLSLTAGEARGGKTH